MNETKKTKRKANIQIVLRKEKTQREWSFCLLFYLVWNKRRKKNTPVNVLVQNILVYVWTDKRDVSIYKQEKNKFVINPSLGRHMS